jgi:tetratricopeptide (TPR) repeat protein
MNEMTSANCQRCGKATGTSAPVLAGLRVCPDCAGIMNDYPFPRWIKATAAGLAVLVVFSVFWNLRFLQAVFEMKHFAAAVSEGDVARAEQHIQNASSLVPENNELSVLASYYRGVLALREEDYAEAIDSLKLVENVLPPEWEAWVLLRQAMLGKAFDDGDYDAFLALSKEVAERNPGNITAQGNVASAYACQYVATGNMEFHGLALQALEKARAMPGANEPSWTEYEQRILHRLDSREIITRDEFLNRFPGDWPGKNEDTP